MNIPSNAILFVLITALALPLGGCSLRERNMDDPIVNLGNERNKFVPEEPPVPTESPLLKTVYFDYDKALLTSQGKEALRYNAEWMKQNPNTKIQIEGHCDIRGTQQYNLPLGERRAQAALDYLVSLGIEAERLSVVSYGRNAADTRVYDVDRRAGFYVIYDK